MRPDLFFLLYSYVCMKTIILTEDQLKSALLTAYTYGNMEGSTGYNEPIRAINDIINSLSEEAVIFNSERRS